MIRKSKNIIKLFFARHLYILLTAPFLFLLNIPNQIYSQNTWTQKADFGGGSRYAMVGVSIGTNGYMGMGSDGIVNKNDWWEYDPIGNTWTQKADFGGSLRGVTIFNSSETKAYVGFGNDGSYKNDWWEYDPIANIWTQLTSCPGNARSSGTSFRIDRNIYITTGFNGTDEYKDLWCYNIDNDSWTQKTDFGGTARYSATAFSIGNYGYVGCGSDDLSWINNDFWEYNSLTDKWTQKNNFSGQQRRQAVGLSIGNKGYIIAGDGNPIQYLNDIWEYSQHNDSWTQKTDKLGVGVYSPSGFAINNKLFIGCGFNHLFSPNYRFDFYEYTPGTTPSVNTTIISNITTTTASSGGDVIFNGNYSVTARGVVWSTSANPTIASQPGGGISSNGTGDGTYTSSLSGLTAGTQYYYRAYATNSQGTSYGEQYTFTTTQTGGTWARQTDFPMTGREGASGFEYNNIGYVVNGSNSSFHKDVWSYDPSTCQWTQKDDFGSVARYHSGAVSLNSKSYILGGYDLNNNYLQDFWEYDPATDVWTQKTNIPSGARFRPAIFSIGSYIYAGLGAKGSGTPNYQNDFFRYDPVANTWTARANFGSTARLGTVYFATSTKGYIGLGYDNTGSYKNDLWEYDPIVNTWTQKANYTGNSRDMAKGFSINDKGYVIAGIQSDGSSYTTANYEYNPIANTWTARASFTGSARYATTGFILNDILYIGMGYNGSYLSDFYSYKPNSEPTLTTTAISAIATTSASSGGNVTATGGEAVTARGLVWSSTANPPTISDYEGITTNGTGTGAFTQTINALCPGTTYYVRAYATNSIGTDYGELQTFTTTASAGDIWVQKANFGGTARNSVVNFQINNKIYYSTGYDISTPRSDTWEYDVYSNLWTQKANYGGGDIRACAGFSIGNKGYLGTGFDGSFRSDFWEYDPSLNIWTSKATFPGSATVNIMGTANSTKGYFIGGNTSAPLLVDEVWEYNPISNTWISKASFPGGVRRLGSLFNFNENIYLMGGHSGGTTFHNDFWMFNPTTNSWIQKNDFIGEPRQTSFSFVIDSKAYVGCGDGSGGTYYKDVFEYDFNLDFWNKKNDFAGPPTGFTNNIGINIGNKGYIGTGYDVAVLNTFYEYTPSKIPSFISGSAGSITQTGATISANYDANFNGCTSSPITDKGLVWNILTNPTTSTNSGSFSAGAGTGNISNYTITGLQAGTTYYVRAYTTTALGTAYGNEVSFSTIAGPPTLTTTAISSIATTSASSGGNVTATGGEAVTARGLVWSSTANPPTISDYEGITTNGTGTGAFTQTINALCPGTTYYVRAYATNTIGTAYGELRTFTTTASAGDIWVQKANFGGVARRNAFSFAIDNYIYLGGGTNGTVQQDFWEFDANANIWTQKANYGGGARLDGKGFTINGKGYVTSGGDGTLNYNDLWEYDRSSNSWTSKANHGGTVRWGGVAFAIGSKGYYGTGALSTQDFWEWDANTNIWTQKSNFPVGTRNAVGFSIGSLGYLGTGVISGSTEDHFYEFNPTNNTWTQKANYAGGIRENATAFSIGTKGYILTGDDAILKKDMWEYNPIYDVWTKKTNFGGTARRQATATANSKKGYLGLGFDGANKNDFWEYTPSTFPTYYLTDTSDTYATSIRFTASKDLNFSGCQNLALTGQGIVWHTSTNPTTTTNIGSYLAGSGNSFDYTITGLTPATTYYARAYTTTAEGTQYGNEFTFTTNDSTPTLTTTAISSIATTTATSGGNVTSDGGDAVTARGLVWSSTTNPPTIASYEGITSNSSGTGTFVQTINGLCPGTTYYVRAYATNSIGTSYGATESFTTTASAGDIWVQKSSFPNGARYQTCNFSISNKIYIGMGTTGFVGFDDLWEYDTDEDTWTQVASFPNGLITGTINFSINGKGYACGGVIGGAWQKTVFEYNQTLNTWTQKNDLPASGPFANRSNGLGLANSTRGYIIGGFDCSLGRTFTEIIEYNPNNDSWVQRANFHTRTANGRPSGFVVDENLYVYTTGNCVSARENSFFCFNTTTNTWSSKADYPGIASTSGIGFSIGNKGYIGTGREESLAVSQSMHEYDVATDRWFQVSNVPTAGTEYAIGLSFGNKAYYGLGNGIGTAWYEYTPSTIPLYFTAEATNVTQTTANIESEYDNNFNGCGDGSVTNKGLVWDVNPDPTTSTNEGSISIGSGNSNFTYTIENLSHSTLYYVRAYTTNSNGTIYGNSITFTTLLPTAPVLGTLSNLAFGDDAIAVSFPLTSTGGEEITNSGFIYSTSPNPDINNFTGGAIVNYDPSIGTNFYHLTGLNPETTYYLVTFAENSIGITYSNEITFTTNPLSSDDDDDGISDEIELIGPNNGDGNGDNIPDALQANIASFMFDANGNFVTVEATNCASLTNVKKIEIENDPKWYYPFGAVEFNVPCGEVEMKIYYHTSNNLNNYVYRKTNLQGEWGTYEGAIFGVENIGGQNVATVEFPLQDGSFGDSDGEVNGKIQDPGGPAIPITANIPIWDWWYALLLIPTIIFAYKKFA